MQLTEVQGFCERKGEECGLPYSEGAALRWDDPIALKIYEIVNSKEAAAAMIEVTEQGLPAICGVEPMLIKALGVDYGGHNMTTNIAGRFIAERMQQLGYKNSGRKGILTEGSVAKSAEIFVKR
jgi:hypothetical protein